MGNFVPDIDIDCANRDEALGELHHIPASTYNKGLLQKHVVGVYFQPIPTDPITGLSSIPYEEAEERGYFKVDFLNLNVYKRVRDEAHLNELLAKEPMWELLEHPEISENLFQLGGVIDNIATSELLQAYKPKSIEQLAMFLAMIRPRKKHLIGCEWNEVEQEIWTPGDETQYGFKKAHAISYAHVVVVEMNLLLEEPICAPSP
jgi:DNA polymerase III alpha subunit